MQKKGIDTANLWSEFKKGNQLAFASIYNLYSDELFIYASKFSDDKELLKDCIQEIFFDLYIKRQSLSETDNIKFYLLKSLKNTIFRKIQRERNISELNKKIIPEFQIEYSFEKKVINDEIEEERKKLVKQILDELKDDNKEILYLRFIQGLNYAEIAEIIGINPDSVKKQVYRSIKKIRKSLGSKSNFVFLVFISILTADK